MAAPKLDFKTTGYGPLVQVIYDHVTSDMIALRFHEGSAIPMESIAEKHGATMMNVHRAFETLQSDGFIRYDREQGVAIVKFGARDVADLTRARIDLELKALRLACIAHDKSEWAFINEPVYQVGPERPFNLKYSQHMRFYYTLYDPGNFKALSCQYDRLMNDFQKYFLHLWQDAGDFNDHMNDAKATLDLCMMGRHQDALNAHMAHIEKTRDRVLENLERRYI